MRTIVLAAIFAGVFVAAPQQASAVSFTGTTTNNGTAPLAGGPCAPLLTLIILPDAPTNSQGTSNLGNFAPTFIECLAGPPPSGADPSSTFNFDFGDGSLFGNYFSSITDFGPIRFLAEFTVTGGTGRFWRSSGSFTALGVVNVGPGGVLVTREFSGNVKTPEPAALGLLGLGTLGLAAARRRKVA